MPSKSLIYMHNSMTQLINSLKHMVLTTTRIKLHIFRGDKLDAIVVRPICNTKFILVDHLVTCPALKMSRTKWYGRHRELRVCMNLALVEFCKHQPPFLVYTRRKKISLGDAARPTWWAAPKRAVEQTTYGRLMLWFGCLGLPAEPCPEMWG